MFGYNGVSNIQVGGQRAEKQIFQIQEFPCKLENLIVPKYMQYIHR